MYDDPVKPKNPKASLSVWDVGEQAERDFGIPTGLLRALGMEESSGFNQYDRQGNLITSPTGPVGALQFTKKTAAAYDADRNKPMDNILAGAAYLRDNYKALRPLVSDEMDAWIAAAIAHNRGLGAVKGMIRDGRFEPGGKDSGNGGDTRAYATRILNNWADLRGKAGPLSPDGPGPKTFMPAASAPVPEVNMTGGNVVPLEMPSNDSPAVTGLMQANPERLAQIGLITPPQVPVPETADTLKAQRSAANDPHSSRIGVLYTPGEKPGLRSNEETDLKMPDGSTLRANGPKLLKFLVTNKLKKADLESGKVDFTPLLGDKADPTTDTANKAAVATVDAKTGKELVTSTVDNPESVPVEAELQKAQFPGQDTQTLLTSSDAVNAARLGQDQPQMEGAPATDEDFAKVNEYLVSQGKEPLTREAFDTAQTQEGSVDVSTTDTSDPGVQQALLEQENQRRELAPKMIEAKTDADVLQKGAAGTFDLDLSQKPIGENTGRFMVRKAFEQIAPEYGLSLDEIDSFIDDWAKSHGGYTTASDAITDSDIAKEKKGGNALRTITITNNILSALLNKRDGLPENTLNPAIRDKVAMASAQMDRSPEVSRSDFGIEPEAEAEAKLQKRVAEPDYAAQQVASQRLTDITSNPLFYVAPWLAAGQQAYKDLTNPVKVDDEWVQSEKDRLLKEHGSFGKALKAEEMYQNADALEKGVRVASQVGRSFLKNVVSGTGKGIVFAGQMFEDLLKKPNPITLLPVNKILPDHLQIGMRNAGNALDFLTRLLTSPDASSAVAEWRKTYVSGDAPISEQQIFKAMQSFDRTIGDDPMLKGRLLGQLADGGGSALAFMASGLLTPEFSVATRLGEFGITPAAWGALSQAGTGYEEGKEAGLDEDKARTYGVIQAILGATEGFGIGGQAGELIKNPVIRGRLAEGILDIAKRGVLHEGGEEFLQELVQTTGGKVALEYLKDKEPSTYQKVINLFKRLPKQVAQTVTNEGLVAFATGGIMGGTGKAAQLATSAKPAENETEGESDKSSEIADLTKNEPEQTGTVEPAEIKAGSTVQDKKGNKFTVVREGDKPGQVVVSDAKGAESLRNVDRLTPVEDSGSAVTDDQAARDKEFDDRYLSRIQKLSDDGEIAPSRVKEFQDLLKDGQYSDLDGRLNHIEDVVAGRSESATDSAHDAATSPENDLPEPTQAQKEAGNYQKGHINISGLDISVENPVGSERSGTDRDGKKWSITMGHHYGYIKRTVGADTEHIDLFVKDHTPADYSGPVFVVDQIHPDTGKFDEHKVMLGFATEAEAREAYASNYAKDWKGLKDITEMPFDTFKEWARAGTKTKPVAAENVGETAQPDTNRPRRQFFEPVQDEGKSSPAPDRESHQLTREEFDAKYPDEKDGQKVTGRDGQTYEVNQGVKGKWFIKTDDRTRVFKNKKDMREFLHGDATHKRAVGRAVREGKEVDANILKSYPEVERRVNKESADRIFRFQADEHASQILADIASQGRSKVDAGELHRIGDKYDVTNLEVDKLVQNADTAYRRRKERGTGTREEGSRPPVNKTLPGKHISVDIAASDKSYKARYELWEASDIHPSHNPFNFNPNEEYFYKNDRHYDKGGEYAANVIQRSMPNKFKPTEVVNTAPTAELGPPIVDVDGNVLGGNSRAMMISRVYGAENPKARDNYLAKLRDDAPAFGFSADDIAKFDHPVLVRKISDKDYDKQTAITDLNKVSTTSHTQNEQAIAEGGNLTPEALDFITTKAKLSGSDASISDILTRHGEDIVNVLLKENIFSQGERNSLLKDGEITQTGKDRITKMLVGHVFEDLEQMQYLPDGYRNAVQRAVIPLIKTEKNADWNLIPATREALDLLTEHQAKAAKQSIDQFSKQVSAVKPEGWSPKSISIAKTIKEGVGETTRAFNTYAGEFRNADEGSMFGALTPDEAFDTAFNPETADRPLASRGEPNVRIDFRQSVDDFMAGKLPYGTSIQLFANTPKVYRLMNAPDKPMLVDYNVLGKILKDEYKHKNDISQSTFYRIPEEIGDPVMVARYVDRETKEVGLNVLTSLETLDGRMIVAGLKFNKKSARVMVHKLATVHAKDSAFTLNRWLDDGDILFVNKKKARTLSTTYSSLLGSVVQKALQANPRILTEANLVKKPLMHTAVAPAPTFYSQVEKVIEEKMPNRAPALQVRNLLGQKNGVKQEEIDWLGINDWLQQNPNPTKAEVLEFVRANNVDVQEVEKGKVLTGKPNDLQEVEAAIEKVGKFQVNASTDILKEADNRILVWDEWADDGTYFDNVKEAVDYVNDRQKTKDTSKFGSHTLPGGENYKELLLTLPAKNAVTYTAENVRLDPDHAAQRSQRDRDLFWFVKTPDNLMQIPKSKYADAQGAIDYVIREKTPRPPEGSHFSRHWDEPNILAHIRFDTRDDGKTLHIAEIQSDWHQAGREKGYLEPVVPIDPDRAYQDDRGKWRLRGVYDPSVNFPTKAAAISFAEGNRDHHRDASGKPPDAPFKKTWQELAMKRMIRYAAENGFERVTWDTGDTQNGRYDLSKQIDSIKWKKISADGYNVEIYKDGKDISDKINVPTVVSKAQLEEYVGKDVAEKITTSEESRGLLEGDGLKVKGTGMIGFYDKILPSFVNKYVKKWGSKVEEGTVETGGNPIENWLDKVNDQPLSTTTVHSVAITPEMRATVVEKGQPLFKIHDAASMNLLYQVLPRASSVDVINHMTGGKFNADDDFEMSEGDAEMTRRFYNELHYDRTGEEYNSPSFDGILFDAMDLRDMARVGRDLAAQLEQNGYSKEHVAVVNKLLDNFDELANRSKDFGVAYVYDASLPEEKFHQEDLRAGRTDGEAIKKLKASPFWSHGGKFEEIYDDLSDADKASEIAAKLATDQAADYGWDKIDNFEEEKTKFLRDWVDGILRRNADKIKSDGPEQFLSQFKRIEKLYAETKKGDSTGDAAGEGERGPGQTRGGPAETERDVGDPAGEETPETSISTAQQESLKEEQAEADALDTTPAEIRAKNRQFAVTLRENGRDAGDVPYIPGTDAERIDEASKILKESREMADNAIFPYGDYEHAIDVFEDPKTDGRTKTALGIALIDHLGSVGEYTMMGRIAEMVTAHVGEAAQALQAATLVSKYDFAKGVMLAKAALEKHGKTMTDADVEEIKRLTDLYATSEKQRAILEYSLGERDNIIRQLKTENAEIDEALGDFKFEIGEQNKLIKNLKLQVEKWKNGATSRSQAASRVSKTHQELIDRKGAIVARLREKFPESASALRSTSDASNIEPGQNVAPEKLDDETRKSLVEYAALQVFDSVPFGETIDNLKELTKGVLTDDDIRSIHADAVDMTRADAVQPSAEILTKMKIRNEHRQEADKFKNVKAAKGSRLFKNPNLNRLDREILHLADGDGQVGTGTVLFNQVRNKDEWYKLIDQFYPDLTAKQKDKLFTKAWTLRNEAKASLEKIRAENVRDIQLNQQEFDALKQQKLIAQNLSRKNRKTLDTHYKTLEKGLKEKVVNVAQQATGIFKGLSATGELSMIGRQNALLWATHPALTAMALEGAGRGLATEFSGIESNILKDTKFGQIMDAVGMRSETQMLEYIERLRANPYFNEAQALGLEFSQIGDFNIADEHFVATVFDAFAEARKVWKVQDEKNIASDLALMPIRIFGRTYKAIELANTLFGDQARLAVYSYYAQQIDGQPMTIKEKREAKRYAALVTNRFSGRGDIHGVLGSNGALSKLANMSFFSLRLLLSRPQSLYHLTTGFVTAPKGMKMIMAGEGLKVYGWLAALALLAGLRLDPEDKDFGKIKYGARDLNIDVLAGLDAPLHWLFGIGLGTFKQIGAMGRGEQSTALKDSYEKLFAKFWYNADMAKKDDSWLSGLRYWRGKASPAASLAFDYFSGKDFIGRTFNWTTALQSRTIPLAYQQTYQSLFYDRYASVMKEPTVATGDRDVMNGLIMFFGTGIGAGITQYPNEDNTKAEQVAWDMYEPHKPGKKDVEQRRIETGLRNLFRMQKEQQDAGKDTGAISRAILKFSTMYDVDSDTLRELRGQGREGTFKFVTKEMSIEQVEKVLAVATPKERPELEEILVKKKKAAEKREESANRPLVEKLKKADTDETVDILKKRGEDLTDAQRAEIEQVLRNKAKAADKKGTLTQDEVKHIKEVLPTFDLKPKPPKATVPKKPKPTTLDGIK